MYKLINFKALISRYLRTNVEWNVQANYEFPYISIVKDKEWKIQTHEFPLEEKYSLYINDQLKLMFSFWPEKYWGAEPEKRWNKLMDSIEKD